MKEELIKQEELELKKKKAQKGFTLIELLVVVAIIAILAAIAIPQFTKYKKKAAIAAAESAITTCISEAAAAYADNSSQTSYDCKVGSSNFTITLDNDTGQVSDPADFLTNTGHLVEYSGYKLHCSYINNKVTCK